MTTGEVTEHLRQS